MRYAQALGPESFAGGQPGLPGGGGERRLEAAFQFVAKPKREGDVAHARRQAEEESRQESPRAAMAIEADPDRQGEQGEIGGGGGDPQQGAAQRRPTIRQDRAEEQRHRQNVRQLSYVKSRIGKQQVKRGRRHAGGDILKMPPRHQHQPADHRHVPRERQHRHPPGRPIPPQYPHREFHRLLVRKQHASARPRADRRRTEMPLRLPIRHRQQANQQRPSKPCQPPRLQIGRQQRPLHQRQVEQASAEKIDAAEQNPQVSKPQPTAALSGSARTAARTAPRPSPASHGAPAPPAVRSAPPPAPPAAPAAASVAASRSAQSTAQAPARTSSRRPGSACS